MFSLTDPRVIYTGTTQMNNSTTVGAITLARGGKGQLNLIETGDILDSTRDRNKNIYTISFSHLTDGRVSIKVWNIMPCACAPKFVVRSGRFVSNRALEFEKSIRLLASDRDRGTNAWVIALGNTDRYIQLVSEDGTLFVRHFNRLKRCVRIRTIVPNAPSTDLMLSTK
jgi:hypothetical protein